MANVSTIVEKLKGINRKDQTSLTISIHNLPKEDQNLLLAALSILEQGTSDKVKGEAKDKQSNKAEEEARFIARLRAKIETIENEQVIVKTRFWNCRPVLLDEIPDNESEEKLLEHFNDLTSLIADLDVLKCLARVKQGKVIQRLVDQGRTIAAAGRLLQIPPSFAERLSLFYRFTSRFPLLPLLGFSFETILKHKKLIEQETQADENFLSKLELTVDLVLENDEDLGLLEEERMG